MEHFLCMQISHRHEPRLIVWQELRPSASQPVGLGGWHDRGGWPGLGARIELPGAGADRAFRIAKSETMKRAD